MQDQLEIGGARALLLLGTSESKNVKIGLCHNVAPDTDINRHTHHTDGQEIKENVHENIGLKFDPSESFAEAQRSASNHEIGSHVSENDEVNDLMDKASQLLNDTVEAAVMRYVGGTLDTGEVNHSDLDAQDDDDDDDDDLSRKRARLSPEDLLSEYLWDKFLEDEVAAGFERGSPKKKLNKTYDSGHEIDPDLDDMAGQSEHDQLMHAAIMSAGELANQLTLPGSPRHRLHQHLEASNESAAIDHLAHATTAPSSGYSPDKCVTAYEQKRSLKMVGGAPLDPNNLSHVPASKYEYSSLEALIGQASNEACVWYNTQTAMGDHRPRLFSPVEINVVEHFLRGYCRLNHLSRMDICRRVWTSDRPKDNFWESVTKVLPYRSKASVYKHIRRQYHVFQVRAKWTPAEDELLQKFTETSTTNWKDIGEAMNRMPEDCRDRWRNYIKCGANRVMNKWSDKEEQSLKSIVMEMITNESQIDKPILINWTVVSERMNGVRSRIQCRYKWNKLLRRESLSKFSMMDTSIKLWMLNRILESNVSELDAVDWDYTVHMYREMHKEKNKILWTTADFKVAFEKMRGSIKDYKNLSLQTVVIRLIDSLYPDTVHDDNNSALTYAHHASKHINLYEELRPKLFDKSRNAEHEAALIANAAVTAVSSRVLEQDAQQQEYSLWR